MPRMTGSGADRPAAPGLTASMPPALARVRADWVDLGTADPLWAVLVDPERRNGGWDCEAFYATGSAEVAAALDRAAALGARPGRALALDFGCGVGRLSVALAEHVHAVIGVDVSGPMIAQARRHDTTGRCTFIVNEAQDLSLLDDAGVDIVYSSLVLQHIPAPYNALFLGELLRVLRPGGLLVVQLATRPDHSLRGRISRIAPRPVLRFTQRVLLRYPAPMEMHALPAEVVRHLARNHDSVVLDEADVPMYGGHWVYTRYFVVKRSADGQPFDGRGGP
jgi:ubiquinone/menaquinone biosynthesis C-methylase UbiE